MASTVMNKDVLHLSRGMIEMSADLFLYAYEQAKRKTMGVIRPLASRFRVSRQATCKSVLNRFGPTVEEFSPTFGFFLTIVCSNHFILYGKPLTERTDA